MSDFTADDSLTEDIWASPSATPKESQPSDRPKTPRTPKTPKTPKTPHNEPDSTYDQEAALRKELEGVKNVNRAVEGIISSLERTRGNMNTVSGTVSGTSALLNTWTRILSQTEHNHRLIEDPSWKGATQDLVDVETEAVQKQQAAERRATEEHRRREEAKRRAEEDEMRRQAGTAAPTRGSRGLRSRGRGVSRGVVRGAARGAAGGAAVGVTRGATRGASSSDDRSVSSIPSVRGSGIGRGVGSVRGRRPRA